ncbi:MAG: MaoC family dehydratase [Proteobacteria bacterium]|nr:MaoC family dehydratase [Pseudomonadota bacterium]
MVESDFSDFALSPKGRFFEDFEEGQVFEHHWGRTINQGDNSLFTTVSLAFVPLYFNADYAARHGHRDVVVNPMLVLCTVVGLSVEDLSEAGGVFLGIEDVVFHQPVYPGDTLTARSRVVARRESKSKKGFGIVSWRTEGYNQRSELVVGYQRSNLVARRVGSSVTDAAAKNARPGDRSER